MNESELEYNALRQLVLDLYKAWWTRTDPSKDPDLCDAARSVINEPPAPDAPDLSEPYVVSVEVLVESATSALDASNQAFESLYDSTADDFRMIKVQREADILDDDYYPGISLAD